MRTHTNGRQRPFGIEFLEPLEAPVRGTQTVVGPDETCCNTYTSDLIVNVWTSEPDTPTGSAFCDDSDTCINE